MALQCELSLSFSILYGNLLHFLAARHQSGVEVERSQHSVNVRFNCEIYNCICNYLAQSYASSGAQGYPCPTFIMSHHR